MKLLLPSHFEDHDHEMVDCEMNFHDHEMVSCCDEMMMMVDGGER